MKTELIAVHVELEREPSLGAAERRNWRTTCGWPRTWARRSCGCGGAMSPRRWSASPSCSNATQLVLGESTKNRWQELLRGSVVHTVIRRSHAVDVHVVAHRRD